MPGVFRPYTLVDVLGVLNDQSTQQQTGTVAAAVAVFAQTGEGTTVRDTVTTTVQANPAWDTGVWGSVTWG